MLKKVLFAGILLIGLVILARLLAPTWYHFLAVNQPLDDADILLVEGWVSESTLQNAAKNFKEGSYEQVVVASILFSNEFNLHSTGALVYDFGRMKGIGSSWDSLSIRANSSLVGGEHAKVMVLADEDTLGEVLTAEQLKKYSFPLKNKPEPVEQIKLVFTNDYYDQENHKDRNISIHSLYVDSTFIPTRTPFVYYDLGKIDGSNIEKVYKSRAGSSAEYLVEQGVPPQVIQIIDAPRVEYNKTYTTAKAVGKWLEEHTEKQHRVNLISENVHSRRSWMLFKKEMPQHVELGIIASSRFENDEKNWWKNRGRKAYVLNQTMKFWYAVLTYYLI